MLGPWQRNILRAQSSCQRRSTVDSIRQSKSLQRWVGHGGTLNFNDVSASRMTTLSNDLLSQHQDSEKDDQDQMASWIRGKLKAIIGCELRVTCHSEGRDAQRTFELEALFGSLPVKH